MIAACERKKAFVGEKACFNKQSFCAFISSPIGLLLALSEPWHSVLNINLNWRSKLAGGSLAAISLPTRVLSGKRRG